MTGPSQAPSPYCNQSTKEWADEHHRRSSGHQRPGPKEWFTGAAWIEEIATEPLPSRLRASRVRFEAGARTAWHTHPTGQTLHILGGIAVIQGEGGAAREVNAGLPPNGRLVVWDLNNIYTFDDEGRITEELVRADNQSVLEQLQAPASPEQSS